jgi:hypothetical protein
MNLYSYVVNSPTNFVDPSGELALPLLVIAIVATGGLVGGIVEAFASFTRGESFGCTAKAFGRGFVAGALGTGVGLATALVTANPYLIGATTGLTINLTDQLIRNNFDISNLDAGDAAISTIVGALTGSAGKKVEAFKTRGRLPNPFKSRTVNEFGINSQKLTGQTAVGSTLSSTATTAILENEK